MNMYVYLNVYMFKYIYLLKIRTRNIMVEQLLEFDNH